MGSKNKQKEPKKKPLKAENIPEGKIQCPECYSILQEGLSFCPECGIRIPEFYRYHLEP